jgi:hypothetical protein
MWVVDRVVSVRIRQGRGHALLEPESPGRLSEYDEGVREEDIERRNRIPLLQGTEGASACPRLCLKIATDRLSEGQRMAETS